MKSILVSSVEAYSGKRVVIIALGRILRDVRDIAERFLERNAMELRGDAKIRGLKKLVERVLDLGRLWGH